MLGSKRNHEMTKSRQSDIQKFKAKSRDEQIEEFLTKKQIRKIKEKHKKDNWTVWEHLQILSHSFMYRNKLQPGIIYIA